VKVVRTVCMLGLSLLVYQCRADRSSGPADAVGASVLGNGWTSSRPVAITGADVFTDCADTSDVPATGAVVEYEHERQALGLARLVAHLPDGDAATDLLAAWSDDPWSCQRDTALSAVRVEPPVIDGSDAVIMWSLDLGDGTDGTRRLAVARFDDVLVVVTATGAHGDELDAAVASLLGA
jgi:hypothetical protein